MGDRALGRAERRRVVGRILRDLREDAKLRQVDVANRLQVPQSLVSKIEAGERTADAVEIVVICRAVGATMGEFVRRLERTLS